MIEPLSFQNVCGQTASGHLLLAKALCDAGHITPAIAQIDRAIEHSPEFGKAYFWKSVLLTLASRYNEAEACLKRSLELEPAAADVWSALATLQYDQGQIADAKTSIVRCLEIDANYVGAHQLAGSIALAENRIEDAIAADRRALQQSPGLSQNRLRLASSLLRSGNEAAAIEEVLTGLRMQSVDVNTRLCLANLLLALGQVDAAIAECKTTSVLFPQSPHPLLRMAQIYADLEQDQVAIAHAKEAINRVPKHIECEMLLAKIYLKHGDAKTALVHVSAALKIDADLFEAHELRKAAEALIASTPAS